MDIAKTKFINNIGTVVAGRPITENIKTFGGFHPREHLLLYAERTVLRFFEAMLRALKIRLYPNKEQEQTMCRLLGCYRYVYNKMLELRINAYKDDKKSLSVCDLSKYYHGVMLKDAELDWLAEQNTKVMKQAIRQLDKAYTNFFKHGKGFPKFKSKRDEQSALFPLEAISKRNTFETKKITLITSLRDIHFRCSKLYHNRLRMFKDGIRSATLSRTKTGKYFLSVLIDIPDDELIRFKHTGNSVGIDLGVKDFVITSDGEVFENKHFLKRQEKRITRLQRQMSKKIKGSSNRNKARLKLARAHEKLVNQKDAYIHSVSNSLLKDYDLVCMEDLNVSGMLKNHSLAKSIAEIGMYRFRQVITDKAMINGKQVVFVDRFYPSSKTCSHCGYIKRDLTLDIREWICPECGEHHDRDVNAAVNILNEGKRIIGSRTAESTLADYPTADDRLETDLKSGDRMKQEANEYVLHSFT